MTDPRSVIETHWKDERWRTCPICQYIISAAHDEAIAQESTGFALVPSDSGVVKAITAAEAAKGVNWE